ncbi:uncharacterized protein MELLADRAFT_103109 [Melampsora larici-populina 98AG31]|uniref:Uncharacterized protein n=1 Tax=Melampsora larici-populina (strain 98AG31 / pathotype 3-4-7) TaxID=747676 RepID=F4RAK6_MELLP|nr:uncharacterized protein MELLADRAFT_103109 [Melampsora larici-populina 98AG31]EGG10498.1 hypothetical protein MELLADRAFT_103109 [Melampsora larici-populina 98AG31]
MAPSTRSSSRASSVSDAPSTAQPATNTTEEAPKQYRASTKRANSTFSALTHARLDSRKTPSGSSGASVPPRSDLPSVDGSPEEPQLGGFHETDQASERNASQTSQEDKLLGSIGLDSRMESVGVGLGDL